MKTTSEKLKEFFEKFPGVGSRQAGRFVYFLFNMNKEKRKEFANLILSLENEIQRCKKCYRFFQKKNDNQEICSICKSESRDSSVLMVVATDADIRQIEQTNYNGVYFVLGGVMPLSGKQVNINDKKLIEYIKENKPKDIILAMPATSDGDYTTDIIINKIKKEAPEFYDNISILGRGLATGTEIEYADKDTIENAIKNKRGIK